MGSVETVIALVSVIVVLLILTQSFVIPYPVILVTGGVLLGCIPGLPHIHLQPHIVFLVFVAPIIYAAGFFVSLRDFRQNLRPIALLAIALVSVTTVAVASVLKWLMPDMPWAIGCLLGAIIAPPDAAAATTIMQRLKIPRRIVTILEGESLFNDASALIFYRFAIAAVVTGFFSFPQAIADFFLMGIGGILLGLASGWLLVQLIKRLKDVIISITISLLAPFIIYIMAEKIQISSILAVVVAGIVMGWYDPKVVSPKKRLKGSAVWETLIFLLNTMAFVLMGLEFPQVIEGLSGENWSYSQLLTLVFAILITITVVRFLWMFFAAYVIRAVFPSIRKYDPYPPWQQVVIIAWSGMRGIVSLGAALSLPMTTLSGEAFPGRDLIIFITFTTIMGTLVLQGITLPLFIKWLKLKEDEGFIKEQHVARGIISKSMMAEIDLLKANNLISERTYDIARRECLFYATSELDENIEHQMTLCAKEIREVRRKIITIGRTELFELHEKGVISKKVTQTIQQELDLDELRLS